MKKAIKQSLLMAMLNVGSIILILLAMVTFIMAALMVNEVSIANDNRFELTLNANRFMDGSAYLTSEVRNYAANGKKVHFDNYWNEINNLKNRDIGVEKINKIGITDDEKKKIDEMSAISNSLVPLESAAMDKVQAGDMDGAIEYVFGNQYEESIGKIRTLQADFLTMLDKRAKAEVKRLDGRVVILETCTAIFFAIVVLFQIISIVITRKKIINPIIEVQSEMREIANANFSSNFELEADTSEIGMLIHSMHLIKGTLNLYINEISKAMGQMAQGDFKTTANVDFIGEFKQIESSIIKTKKQMSDMLSQINMSSNQVSVGAGQVASGAQALAQGSTEQASTVDELSNAISGVAEQISVNAENAARASELAEGAVQAIGRSNEQMGRLIVSMNDIDAKSQEISKIIKTIEDIAFQTNILALNAAVEAARAGAAGKGFAVVADEVRNLAGKSAEAAKSTTQLIEDSVSAIAGGVNLTNHTANELSVAVNNVMSTTQVINQITQASAEQARAVQQITAGVDQVAAVVQLNSATSEESAAASEELSGQADLLKELITRFKLA